MKDGHDSRHDLGKYPGRRGETEGVVTTAPLCFPSAAPFSLLLIYSLPSTAAVSEAGLRRAADELKVVLPGRAPDTVSCRFSSTTPIVPLWSLHDDLILSDSPSAVSEAGLRRAADELKVVLPGRAPDTVSCRFSSTTPIVPCGPYMMISFCLTRLVMSIPQPAVSEAGLRRAADELKVNHDYSRAAEMKVEHDGVLQRRAHESLHRM
ncbi:unnamed protein product [Ranitomeya imitator]|uniref:Uncharacterized protein n=1 Tax=Ranitomeya imitator TaxID=111125 RepID=A0ABN9LE33_9NEOB|nr:unnamed protein product [Ranitomeya imitator]